MKRAMNSKNNHYQKIMKTHKLNNLTKKMI